MGHLVYQDVGKDRVTCLETLTSPMLIERVKQLGTSLISYLEL